MSRSFNVQFNPESSYNVVSGTTAVIPYQQNKVNDETNVESKNYYNKFVNPNVSMGNKIKLTEDDLNEIKQSVTKPTTESRVYSQSYTSTIHIDSRHRSKQPINIYEKNIYQLAPYSIEFTDKSSLVTLTSPNHPFVTDDRIILDNVVSKNVILYNVIMVKKNSLYIRIFHKNHGLSLYGTYDPSNADEFISVNYVDQLPPTFNPNDDIPDSSTQYYILKKNLSTDIKIVLSNIKGNDATRSLLGNIPINYINRKQTVILLFTKSGTTFQHDQNSYVIQLLRRSSVNYQDGISTVVGTTTVANNTTYIRFSNLYGIPLNYLNSGTPINSDRKYPYVIVTNTTQNTLTVEINYKAIVDPNVSFYSTMDTTDSLFDISQLIGTSYGGGTQCYIRKIKETQPGYPNPNDYVINLDRVYKNIIQARIIGSAFPNSQRVVNNDVDETNNNRLYWRNLDDGNYIYTLSITPGNYSPNDMAKAIEIAFSNTIRYPYTLEYSLGITQSIITSSTPTNDIKYDDDGNYKYHIVNVTISEQTDNVTFKSFKELIQQDRANEYQILVIPDCNIQFTCAENFKIDFGLTGTGIVPQQISPFDPSTETLYIYFTQNCQIRIPTTYPYAYGNLYKYIEQYSGGTDGYNTFSADIVGGVALLTNFYRNKTFYPFTTSVQEINSINTTTVLDNFTYNYLTNDVFLPGHSLRKGDLIITDQFVNPANVGQIYVYEVISVQNNESFRVIRYNQGQKYKFIYDGIIINFNQAPAFPSDAYYWLDQILSTTPVSSLPFPYTSNNNTLSLTAIVPTAENKKIIRIRHPSHQLKIGDQITIANSASINQVPREAINTSHLINRIIDPDHYEVLLDKYTPLSSPSPIQQLNIISITYPDIFQMLFNFNDTLGNLLSFSHVGEPSSITSYGHTIKNTDEYANGYDYDTLGNEYQNRLTKLNMSGDDYFYISSPQLGFIRNTQPVTDVFSVIRWTDLPGTVVFDSFVPCVNIFDIPIAELGSIGFTMYRPNGQLVEFNNLDHSFEIELVEVYNQPEDTNVNVRIDSEMIVRKLN